MSFDEVAAYRKQRSIQKWVCVEQEVEEQINEYLDTLNRRELRGIYGKEDSKKN